MGRSSREGRTEESEESHLRGTCLCSSDLGLQRGGCTLGRTAHPESGGRGLSGDRRVEALG